MQGEGDFKQNNMKSYPSLGRWPALHLKITSFGGFFLIFPEFPCIHMCICALRTIYFLCFAQMEKYGLFFFFFNIYLIIFKRCIIFPYCCIFRLSPSFFFSHDKWSCDNLHMPLYRLADMYPLDEFQSGISRCEALSIVNFNDIAKLYKLLNMSSIYTCTNSGWSSSFPIASLMMFYHPSFESFSIIW